MTRGLRFAVLITLAGWPLFGQSTETSGFAFYERFQGSASSLGWVNQLDTSVGYNFGAHFSLDAGLPVYFIRPSSSTIAATWTSSGNGIGNVYAQLRLSEANPIVNFASTLTGTAPTGDKTNGFSTGHATVDWSNYFEHSFSQLTPFFDVGIANAVSDTMFFIRPYTTYGVVTHVEGGARYRLVRGLSLGVSGFAIEPSGAQTVVSRLVRRSGSRTTTGGTSTSGSKTGGTTTSGSKTGGTTTSGSKTSGSGGRRVFQNTSVTTGTADIARDNGFSTWLQIAPATGVSLYAGYTRSTHFALNTAFFGISFNLGRAIRRLGI
jgi:hypothetical protein